MLCRRRRIRDEENGSTENGTDKGLFPVPGPAVRQEYDTHDIVLH